MLTARAPEQPKEIVYPESDGMPMADNTLQFRWIVTIQGGLDLLFRDNPSVFVAGDLLWYPIEGEPTIRVAPDVMVVFGRPKGDRGAYLQWREGGIAPQVVFEILSPGNTVMEMTRKLGFYDRYGVEEYYLYDPDRNELSIWIDQEGGLTEVEDVDGWISPRLGIRFAQTAETLKIYRPDGAIFDPYVELGTRLEMERQRAEQERQRAEQERQRAERLAAQLRALGVDPDQS
ncbi:MAG: Uma2 family endonuclease [Caldilineaceae bacterium]|nr:Uma2 family endonuclease [Caldilineaceae bacterium]